MVTLEIMGNTFRLENSNDKLSFRHKGFEVPLKIIKVIWNMFNFDSLVMFSLTHTQKKTEALLSLIKLF